MPCGWLSKGPGDRGVPQAGSIRADFLRLEEKVCRDRGDGTAEGQTAGGGEPEAETGLHP